MEQHAKTLLMVSLGVLILGGVIQTDYLHFNRDFIYTIGFMISFIATEMMEVAITNLTANVAPSHLYRSKFNPSFMLTLIGLLGRFLGCLLLPLTDLVFQTNEYKELITYMYTPIIVLAAIFLIVGGVLMSKHKE